MLFEKINAIADDSSRILAVYFPLLFCMILASMAFVSIPYSLITKGYIDANHLYVPYKFT